MAEQSLLQESRAVPSGRTVKRWGRTLLWGGWKEKAGKKAQEVARATQELKQKAQKKAQEAERATKEVATKLKEATEKKAQEAERATKEGMDKAKAAAETKTKEAEKATKEGASKLKEATVKKASEAEKSTKEAAEKIEAAAEEKTKEAVKATREAAEKIKEAEATSEKKSKEVVSAAVSAGGALVESGKELGKHTLDKGKGLVNNMVGGLTGSGNVMQDLTAAVDDLKNKITSIGDSIKTVSDKVKDVPQEGWAAVAVMLEQPLKKYYDKYYDRYKKTLIKTCDKISWFGGDFDVEFTETRDIAMRVLRPDNGKSWEMKGSNGGCAIYKKESTDECPKFTNNGKNNDGVFDQGWSFDKSAGVFSLFVKSGGCRARVDWQLVLCRSCSCAKLGYPLVLGSSSVNLIQPGTDEHKGPWRAEDMNDRTGTSDAKGSSTERKADLREKLSCGTWAIGVDVVTSLLQKTAAGILAAEVYSFDATTLGTDGRTIQANWHKQNGCKYGNCTKAAPDEGVTCKPLNCIKPSTKKVSLCHKLRPTHEFAQCTNGGSF